MTNRKNLGTGNKPEHSTESSNFAPDKTLISDTSLATNERWVAVITDVALNSSLQSYIYLFEFFAPKLKTFFITRGVAHDEAEELIQETFITVWNKANSYNANKAYVSTWIYTIARNKKLDNDRKKVRHNHFLNEIESFDTNSYYTDTYDQSDKIDLMNCVDQLPDTQATILKCVYFEGKSHQATAEELEITLGKVKGQIRSALNTLRKFVKNK